MTLSRLEIAQFRNLTDVKLEPSEAFNIFYGENGSGKTSLLEAIYHLGFARSFRTSVFHHLIQRGCEKFSVFGEVASVPIGIERYLSGQFSIRLRRKDVDSSAELASILPLQLINHTVYHLIDCGPKERRRFIDWGVFHVKQQVFLSLWKKMNRLLKQRNAALKIRPFSKRQVALWQDEFVKTTELITKWRREYLGQFRVVFLEVVNRFLTIDSLDFVFYPGWDVRRAFRDVLIDTLQSDIERGHTQMGPHRADLRIYMNKTPVDNVLSRGQLKLFTCAMRLAQASLLQEQTQRDCIFLIDDLTAELDGERTRMVCDFLKELHSQVFLTSHQQASFDNFFGQDGIKKFHVDHGRVCMV